MGDVFKKAIWSGVLMALGSLLTMYLDGHRRKKEEEAADRLRKKQLDAQQAEYDMWLRTMKQAKDLGFAPTPYAATANVGPRYPAGC